MKHSINFLRLPILPAFIILAASCAQKSLVPADTGKNESISLSEKYNHFKGGVLFSDVDFGLHVLWESSFSKGRVYKENLGFFVAEGLLILPNENNTRNSSSITTLSTFLFEKKLFVEFRGSYLEVLGIVHSHPDPCGVQAPTPVSDFQYAYLGIHNYIIGRSDIFDAYKNGKGVEVVEWLGNRNSYSVIPFVNAIPPLYTLNTHPKGQAELAKAVSRE